MVGVGEQPKHVLEDRRGLVEYVQRVRDRPASLVAHPREVFEPFRPQRLVKREVEHAVRVREARRALKARVLHEGVAEGADEGWSGPDGPSD